MPIVADRYLFVVGVDTHADTHHYAIINTHGGALVADAKFPTTDAGLGRALDWIARRACAETDPDPELVLISMEGTRSYGAVLADRATAAGYRVVDAPAPRRPRGAGKTDQLDATLAARDAMVRDLTAVADLRGGIERGAMQILLTARNAMATERTRHYNQLTALLRTYPLGVDARKKPGRRTIDEISKWRARTEDHHLRTGRAEAVRLASRIRALDKDLTANKAELHTLVAATKPALLDLVGVGPVNAAIAICAFAYRGRIRTREGFAKLAGVCPIEVSSGKHAGHRLNRSGDRQLNRALHSIAQTRIRKDPETITYIARRTAQGQTHARIRRCLKRYISNEIYALLNTPTTA